MVAGQAGSPVVDARTLLVPALGVASLAAAGLATGGSAVIGPPALTSVAALLLGLAGLTLAIQGLAGIRRHTWETRHWSMLGGLALSTLGTAVGALTTVVIWLVVGGA